MYLCIFDRFGEWSFYRYLELGVKFYSNESFLIDLGVYIFFSRFIDFVFVLLIRWWKVDKIYVFIIFKCVGGFVGRVRCCS